MKIKVFDTPIDITGVSINVDLLDSIRGNPGSLEDASEIKDNKTRGRVYNFTGLKYVVTWVYISEERTCCHDREYGCAYLGDCTATSSKKKTLLGVQC